MEPLHILIICERFAPSIGGLETHLETLSEFLVERGVSVTVAATKMSPAVSGPERPYEVSYGPGWGAAWRLLRQASVVHLTYFDYRWLLLAKLAGRRVVLVYHSHARVCPKGVAWNGKELCSFSTHWRVCPGCLHRDAAWPSVWSKWASLPIKQWIGDRVDASVSISRYAEHRFRLARNRTIVNGIDVRRFRPAESPTRDFALFIGRLIFEKGAHVLLDALAQCQVQGRPVRLIIVGDGPQRGALEEQAHRLGIAPLVEFRGVVSGAPLTVLLQQAFAVVVPSLGPETCPLTPLEAMACGTPVIAAASGGLEEIAGAAGLLYPPLDRAALAGRLTRLIEDRALQRRLAEQGRRLVEREYDVTRMGSQYLDLYRSVVNGCGTAQPHSADGAVSVSCCNNAQAGVR